MAKRPPKQTEARIEPEPAAAEATPRIVLVDQIIGQAAAKRSLQAAMKSGRIHHAWIFHGPPGVGKFSTAVAFAAALLDPTTSPDLGGNLAPEDGSQVQQMIRAGTHPDLHVITKELAAVSREQRVRDSKQSGIAKDVIDEFLVEPASRSRVHNCASLACKVFIIDEAELLSPVSQNALLKTLEEPPGGSVLILITSAEERLLPTIRSRCQRVSFTPLEEPEMGKWLSGGGGGAGAKALTKDRRAWLLKFAAGSPGAAKTALENDLFEWEEAIRPALDEIEKGRFPLNLGSTMAKLIDDRAAAAVKANPDASKDAANKAWARRMLGFVGEEVRQRLRSRTAGRVAAQIESDPAAGRWLHAVDAISDAEEYLATNVNLGLLLENLAAQMSAEPAPV